jgi:hypothetical protein
MTDVTEDWSNKSPCATLSITAIYACSKIISYILFMEVSVAVLIFVRPPSDIEHCSVVWCHRLNKSSTHACI